MKKTISFVVFAALSLPLVAADEAAQSKRLSHALSSLKTGYYIGSAELTLSQLITEQYEPACEAVLNIASVRITKSSGMSYSGLDFLSKLVRANYEPAFLAATEAASNAFSSTQYFVQNHGINLFTELVKAKYQPAFSLATDAAISRIGDLRTLKLFLQLVRAKHEPSFTAALDAANKALEHDNLAIQLEATQIQVALLYNRRGLRSRL